MDLSNKMAKAFRAGRFVYTLLIAIITAFPSFAQQKNDSHRGNTGYSAPRTSGTNPKAIPTRHFEHVTFRCALQDHAGNIWFGTTGEGLYRFNGKSFTQFTTDEGLDHDHVWSLAEDKEGNIWIGTTKGLCRYDGQRITPVPLPAPVFPSENSGGFYNEWSQRNTVWSLLSDRKGKLLLGTGDGVLCFDGKTFTRFLDRPWISNPNRLHLRMIDHMLEDRSGNYWFASGMPPGMEGLCFFDGKELVNYKLRGQEWIYSMMDDGKGNLWLCTRHNGIVRYNQKNFEQLHVGGDAGLACSSDKDGNVWFSTNTTQGKGSLWKFDGVNYTNFTVKDGLKQKDVFLIFCDRSGSMWIGTTDFGLYRYDGKRFIDFAK